MYQTQSNRLIQEVKAQVRQYAPWCPTLASSQKITHVVMVGFFLRGCISRERNENDDHGERPARFNDISTARAKCLFAHMGSRFFGVG